MNKSNYKIEPDFLVEKSIQSFLLAIEIINKPTIDYRVEGFCFFICNAWELLIKGYLISIDQEKSVFYSNGRTKSLSPCVKLIFTNDKDPKRINLEAIINLRNTATHLIIQDYEDVYAPIFQANIINYANKLNEFFSKDIEDFINGKFLALVFDKEALVNQKKLIKEKGEIVVKSFISKKRRIDILRTNNSSPELAIDVRQNIVIIKNKKDAEMLVAVTKDSKIDAIIMKEPKDINSSYPYNPAKIIDIINKRCFQLLPKRKNKYGDEIVFNKHDFQLFSKENGIKNNLTFCYGVQLGKQISFKYSQACVDYIFNKLLENPNLLENYRQKNRS